MQGFQLNGIDEIKKELKQLSNLKEIQKIVKSNGSELQQKAMRKASFKGHVNSSGEFVKPTGATKRSIQLELKDGGMSAHVNPGTHYAPYVEWGTRFMSPQPFMRPAWREQAIQFQKDLEKLLK